MALPREQNAEEEEQNRDPADREKALERPVADEREEQHLEGRYVPRSMSVIRCNPCPARFSI